MTYRKLLAALQELPTNELDKKVSVCILLPDDELSLLNVWDCVFSDNPYLLSEADRDTMEDGEDEPFPILLINDGRHKGISYF